ncbi:MAG TPA: hypothetical protein VH253_16540 [Phycisphaerae bacterium]|nr:hypothetical protein [Phycisphaerae bacterium]
METMTEELLNAAACEAMGANTAAESVAYQQQLSGADEGVRRTDRELRQTAARLSAASPHLNPPADLRARILEATAPATFNMEAYRKATGDSGRFYRWGFYAAMLFLTAGAYYNIALQGKLKQANSAVAAATSQVKDRDAALRAFVNPNTTEVRLIDQNSGKTYGKALVDAKAHTAVVILPDNLVPPNQTASFSYNNQTYNTVLVRTSGYGIDTPAGKPLDAILHVNNVQPDPHVAQVGY